MEKMKASDVIRDRQTAVGNKDKKEKGNLLLLFSLAKDNHIVLFLAALATQSPGTG